MQSESQDHGTTGHRTPFQVRACTGSHLGPLVLFCLRVHVKKVRSRSLQELRLKLVAGVVDNHDRAWPDQRGRRGVVHGEHRRVLFRVDSERHVEKNAQAHRQKGKGLLERPRNTRHGNPTGRQAFVLGEDCQRLKVKQEKDTNACALAKIVLRYDIVCVHKLTMFPAFGLILGVPASFRE